MLFHRNPRRTFWVLASAVLLLAMTLAPAVYAADSSAQEAAVEADSSFLVDFLERVREILVGPRALGAADDDPREDDQEDEEDPDDSGGGILSPSPTVDPGGGRRW